MFAGLPFSRTSKATSLLASALLVLACSAVTAQDCGDKGRAQFNTNGLPQGYEGELFSATHCFVEGTYCDSETLPAEARGSKETVAAYYGEDLGAWCTGYNTDFSYAFYNLQTFNDPVRWRISRASKMEMMFFNCTAFNQDISGWDVSDTENFFGTFALAESFDQPLIWDTSKAVEMFGMFTGARAFTGKGLEDWDVSQVTSFGSMFANATSFNADISGWDVSSGCLFDLMFNEAASFDQDLNTWGALLKDKLCDGAPPGFYYMFIHSGCPLKSSPAIHGSFCHPAATDAPSATLTDQQSV